MKCLFNLAGSSMGCWANLRAGSSVPIVVKMAKCNELGSVFCDQHTFKNALHGYIKYINTRVRT